YQPELVTVCLGQNDGVQDSVAFCTAYVDFIEDIRSQYPKAYILCLSSPMADPVLNEVLQSYLPAVVQEVHRTGDEQVGYFFFSKQYTGGCDSHPNLEDHALIAGELTAYLKRQLGW
ncbi:MAG: hypothetical protein KDC44_02295, partial [Phaeodactylibacter sp.]|nr:hypothetical protein [Phaeodactylibacter sp.]